MNILFLTLLSFDSLQERNIYTDLLREFIKFGHFVYAISPVERRQNQRTHLIEENNSKILRLQIGNTQKTNIIEKGISTVMIEPSFKNAIKRFFSDVHFDVVLYSTPPITLVGAIEYVKNRDGAETYLLLKDIFPQNALDIALMKTKGVKGILYKHFRKQEKRLYAISDHIGCMSKANVDYLIEHNPEVNSSKVEICPNSIDAVDKSVDWNTACILREKYELPVDKKIFVYGGNLGKPQGIPFLIECLRKCRDINDAFFFIVGDGTEYPILMDYINAENPSHVKLLSHLPKEDYDAMVGACDVGMIFLDHRFTIPNFPSRLLAYMQAKIPVLAVTDTNTDIGDVITCGGFGWWCESNDSDGFVKIVNEIVNGGRLDTEAEYNYLIENYHSSISAKIILEAVEKDEAIH